MDYINHIKKLSYTFGKILEVCPELTFIGNPILRQKTARVSLDEGIQIGNKLKVTLEKYRKLSGFGRGLAAPQIGESKSVFVTYIEDTFKIYINPKIVDKSLETNFYRESCLSCGFLSVDVNQSVSITFEYIDEDGKTQTEHLEGFYARLIQHEQDHLDGVMNVDKAEPNSINFMINDPLKELLRDNK